MKKLVICLAIATVAVSCKKVGRRKQEYFET
jgi:hypothetical protein